MNSGPQSSEEDEDEELDELDDEEEEEEREVELQSLLLRDEESPRVE